MMSGTTPAMNAKEVIRIGRSLIRAASSAAWKRSCPFLSRSRANSTIRIAFLHASPTRTSRPIWVKTLLSPRVSHTPAIADTSDIGTISTITSGNDQLSYWAASTRKTSRMQRGKTRTAVLPASFC